MPGKKLRDDRILRIIEITAEYLGHKLTQRDRLEILEKCRQPGRPRRRSWTDAQLVRLSKMQLELAMRTAASPTEAARMVAETAPFEGKPVSATFHWLRRYYAEFDREQSMAKLRRSLRSSLGREPETGKKSKP